MGSEREPAATGRPGAALTVLCLLSLGIITLVNRSFYRFTQQAAPSLSLFHESKQTGFAWCESAVRG